MQINWKRVAYNDEAEEFERTTEEFTTEAANYKSNLKLLQNGYRNAKLKSLSIYGWKKLQNSDSYSTTTIEDVQKAIKKNGEPRNMLSIINEFLTGSVRAPIVIRLGDGSLYLVAGNTRLMVARMLEIMPKVVIIETDW